MRHSLRTSACLAFLFASTLSHAQSTPETDASSGGQLDRIEGKIDQLSENSAEEKSIFVDEPLGNRRHGIEFNFFRILTLSEDAKSLTGTYSIFNTTNNTEIAFPIFWGESKHDEYYGGPVNSEKMRSFTVDAHYRKYLDHRIDGFYISGFARLASLSGVKEGSYSSSYDLYNDSYTTSSYDRTSEVKLGVGVGIGYRVVSKTGLYWGVSLSVGKYIIGDNDIFSDSDASTSIDDEEFIIDMELLKFGYAF